MKCSIVREGPVLLNRSYESSTLFFFEEIVHEKSFLHKRRLGAGSFKVLVQKVLPTKRCHGNYIFL